MLKRSVEGPQELKKLVGEEIGPSDWFAVNQKKIDTFAEAIDDDEWLHVDVEKARSGPFGTTIAHGFFSVALVPPLLRAHLDVSGFRLGVNYGLNKLRFPGPVMEGSSVRLVGKVADVVEIKGGLDLLIDFTIEVQDQERPASTGQIVFRYLV